MFNGRELSLLERIASALERIERELRPRLSAMLYYLKNGECQPMTSLRVGQTANPNYQEWDGPNGTGNPLPPAGPVTYASDAPSVATVDQNSGVVTAVAVGTANITADDSTDDLSATAQITVVDQAVSATLGYTPN
jgi:hypothetical protein